MSEESVSQITADAWGRFRPRGRRRFLQFLVQMGLAHGPIKGLLSRQWFAAGPREPVDVTRDGLRLRLHPWDNTVEIKLLFASRARDREELAFLAEHCRGAGTFLDVGANVGFYSLAMISRGAGRALAVEPLPTAFGRMTFNIQANGFEERIQAVQAALGAERTTVRITEMTGDLGGSSIVKGNLPGRSIEVPLLPLGELLQERSFSRVDAMKIDVEGMEDRVLAPFFAKAPRTLWPQAVVIEHTHGEDWREDILEIMQRAGYRSVRKNRSNALLTLGSGPG
ncbi:MAG: FkbM family methyltransferase [Verrucomicrobiales bacterium]|nr:FkbM family methyltransferase [Verrucomicrobiales bacterium]